MSKGPNVHAVSSVALNALGMLTCISLCIIWRLQNQRYFKIPTMMGKSLYIRFNTLVGPGNSYCLERPVLVR